MDKLSRPLLPAAFVIRRGKECDILLVQAEASSRSGFIEFGLLVVIIIAIRAAMLVPGPNGPKSTRKRGTYQTAQVEPTVIRMRRESGESPSSLPTVGTADHHEENRNNLPPEETPATRRVPGTPDSRADRLHHCSPAGR